MQWNTRCAALDKQVNADVLRDVAWSMQSCQFTHCIDWHKQSAVEEALVQVGCTLLQPLALQVGAWGI